MSPPAANAPHPLLVAPILPTLLRLSLPNLGAILAVALVAIIETVYVGSLGIEALAGMALVLPMIMLQQMMSAGAMGGGVSSAISRALGVGDQARAQALAMHAVVIGAVVGLLFLVLFEGFGRAIYRLLGGRDGALDQALAYSNVFFLAAPAVWLMNTFSSILRGTGNMRVPSTVLFVAAGAQLVIGGCLGLGLGPFPRLGMAGVALGPVIALTSGALVLFWYVRAHSPVRLVLRGTVLRWEMFHDILKVGALACLSSLQTVLTILVLTALVARFGIEMLAGYGIGARLEFLLVPSSFAIGVSCVPLVGMAVGAGDVARARQIAWTAGGIAAVLIGSVGLAVALVPNLWSTQFTNDPATLDAARTYLRWAGPGYGFFALGLCLYFASQGAGKVLGPVLAGTVRLVLIAVGGWVLVVAEAPPWTMFALVSISMVAYGLAVALAVRWTRWERG